MCSRCWVKCSSSHVKRGDIHLRAYINTDTYLTIKKKTAFQSKEFFKLSAHKDRTPPRRDGAAKMTVTSGMGSRDQSTESVTSLASSGTNGQTTASPESTLSYHSNQSTPAPSMTSPTAQRPHSITSKCINRGLYDLENISISERDYFLTKQRYKHITLPDFWLKNGLSNGRVSDSFYSMIINDEIGHRISWRYV